MYPQLANLLPQLLAQDFDAIFMLDDHSRDHTAQKVKDNFKTVKVVEGVTNVGSAGNRNRILPALTANGFDMTTIIVFIDADVTLVNDKPIARTVKELFKKYPSCGMIGGQVLNADGSWSAFNYGPLPLWRWMRTSSRQLKLENLRTSDPKTSMKGWQEQSKALEGWPNPFQKPAVKEVGWLVENFIFIRAATFAQVGGYDSSLRYCEALDMGEKLGALGLASVFDPSLVIKHLQIDNRGWHRNVEVFRAVFRLAGRHIWRHLYS